MDAAKVKLNLNLIVYTCPGDVPGLKTLHVIIQTPKTVTTAAPSATKALQILPGERRLHRRF